MEPKPDTYTQVIDLIAGLGRRAKIVRLDLIEFYSPADIDGILALTAARVVVRAIGSIVQQVLIQRVSFRPLTESIPLKAKHDARESSSFS